MKKILIANWKMNPQTEAEALALARAQDNEQVIICPPFVFLEVVSKEVKKAKIGAQDVSYKEGGARTGEVAAQQLKEVGARYVIIGHSERRIYQGDTDEIVEQKIAQSINAGLTPIICIGETLEERNAGNERVVIDRQLGAVIRALGAHQGEVFIAYEPVWSISTFAKGAQPISTDEAHTMLLYIQSKLGTVSAKKQLLYGGSVNEANLAAFIAPSFVAGALVGAASLSKESTKSMLAIIN